MQIPHFGGALKINVESFARKHGADHKILPDPASEAYQAHRAMLEEVMEIEQAVRPHLDEINHQDFDYFLQFNWDTHKQADVVYASSLSSGFDTPMVTFHRNAKSAASDPPTSPGPAPSEPTINPLDPEPVAPVKKTFALSGSESRTDFIARVIRTLKDGLLDPYKKYQKPLK